MARHKEIYATAEWESVRLFVISRADGLCEACRAKGIIKPGKEVDHIVELSEANKCDWNVAYNPGNLRLLCADCHQHKHGRSIGLQDFLMPVDTEAKTIVNPPG